MDELLHAEKEGLINHEETLEKVTKIEQELKASSSITNERIDFIFLQKTRLAFSGFQYVEYRPSSGHCIEKDCTQEFLKQYIEVTT